MLSKVGYSLPSRRRIKQRSDFEQALRAPSLTNPWFAIHLRKNEYGVARLGMVVSKRTIPAASARNFVKRMIREAFRTVVAADYAVDMVVRAKRQVAPEAAEGRAALIRLLQSVPK